MRLRVQEVKGVNEVHVVNVETHGRAFQGSRGK